MLRSVGGVTGLARVCRPLDLQLNLEVELAELGDDPLAVTLDVTLSSGQVGPESRQDKEEARTVASHVLLWSRLT